MARPSGTVSPLGQTRERVYHYVRERLLAGFPPTVREIQSAMGFRSIGAVQDHLRSLVDAGKLINEPGVSRCYRLPHDERLEPSAVRVPILGEVQAGNLTLALETPEGHIAVQSRYPADELFALRVKGRSMVGAGIFPGDMVVVRQQRTAENGDIVVALIDDEATIKKLKIQKTQCQLLPANPHFNAIVVDRERFLLLGKVIHLHRDFE